MELTDACAVSGCLNTAALAGSAYCEAPPDSKLFLYAAARPGACAARRSPEFASVCVEKFFGCCV
jgi:hypothetical protein